MDRKKPERRCTGTTKAGRRCRAAALKDSDLCFFHADPVEAARLGRIGGRKNRRALEENSNPLPELKSLRDVQNLFARLAIEVYSGKKDPKIAMAVKAALSGYLQVFENLETHDQITELQNQIDRLNAIRRVSENDAAISTNFTDLEAEIEEAPGKLGINPPVGAKNVSGAATETGKTNPNRTNGDYEFSPNLSASRNGLIGTTGETQLSHRQPGQPQVLSDWEFSGNHGPDSHLALEPQPVPGALWRKAPPKPFWSNVGKIEK